MWNQSRIVRRRLILSICSILLATTQCRHTQHSNAALDFSTLVPKIPVDLQTYMGTWYEIACIPHHFEKDCYASQSVYSPTEDDDIGVVSTCHKGSLTGPVSQIRGFLRQSDDMVPNKIEISFFWPIWMQYWILEISANYDYAVVGHNNRKFVWIFSRHRHLDTTLYQDILKRLDKLGFDVAQIRQTQQPEDTTTPNL